MTWLRVSAFIICSVVQILLYVRGNTK
jgi:hypothetical protein